MDVNILDIFILLSCAQGFIFGIAVLFSNYFKEKVNHYLAYHVMIISIIGFDEWFTEWGLSEQYYFLDFFGDDVPWILLVYVPLFFFFWTKVHPGRTRPAFLKYLALPFLIFLGLNIWIDLDVDAGLYEIPNIISVQFVIYSLETYLAIFYSICLGSWALWLIVKAQLKQELKRWLFHIWLFSYAILLIWVGLAMVPAWMYNPFSHLDYIIWVGIAGFIYWINIRGIFQFKLAREHVWQLLSSSEALPLPPQEKQSSGKKAKAIRHERPLFLELERLMGEEQIYLNSKLDRASIADYLQISPGYVSSIIKEARGISLSQYISSYRITYVKRLLKDPTYAHYSLLAIGMEAGFTSRSAFFTSFKKETGMTPNEYKQSQL